MEPPKTPIQKLAAAVVDTGDDGSPQALAARAALKAECIKQNQAPRPVADYMAMLKTQRAHAALQAAAGPKSSRS